MTGLLFPRKTAAPTVRAATGRVVDTPTLFGMGGGAVGKLGVDLGATAQPIATGGVFGDPATAVPASWHRAMAAGQGGAAPVTVILTPTIVNTTGRPMQMEVEETTDARGQRQQRYIVSDLTGQGLTTPGGAGRRALRQQFGLGPQARSRG